MSLRIGIDLGTTNSAVACIDEHGKAVVTPNRLGHPVTPSVVAFRGGEVLVGEEAKELMAAGSLETAAFFKRQMGEPRFLFPAAGRDHSAVDLSAMLLAHLKEEAESALGSRIDRAVITVPAYFRDPQRQATLQAGRQAGLEVLQLVNEPTAAAIAYGGGRGEAGETLLVYDLGGGTFDVTLLRLEKDEIRILSSDGDHELGGKDWDDRIVEFLASRFHEEHGVDPLEDGGSFGDLYVRAEELKQRLSSVESASASLVHDGNQGRYHLERATFEAISADLLERTAALVERLLEDQGLTADRLDGVLLVGGSTRMPMVHELLRSRFGHAPRSGVNPDEAVALGAAIVAAEKGSEGPRLFLGAGRRTVDVTNHSLGMIAVDATGTAYVNSVILPKNRPIPCHETRPYRHRTRPGDGNRIEVFMTQGESGSPADVSYMGRYVLGAIPHPPGGRVVLDIEYHYDESGTVQVSGRVRGFDSPLSLEVEPLPADVPDRFLQPPNTREEPAHVTAYLAFDLSGSMSGEPLLEAKRAARGFVENTDLAHCSLGVIGFADRVKTHLRASQNARDVERAIEALSVGEVGFTNEADPFEEIHSLLAQVEGPRFAITLADGVWAHQDLAVRRAELCHEKGIETVAVGFGDADRSFLAAIASSDEGAFFTSLTDLVTTFSTIAQVLTERQGKAASLGPAGGSTAHDGSEAAASPFGGPSRGR